MVPAARAGRSASNPRRTRVEGMLPKGFLGPVSSETGRSPECATRSEGLRKRVSGRSLRRQPHVGAGSLEREANGGRRLGRPVVGRLGQTGRLDLARPGAAAVACPGIALRARVPPRVVRARRLQAASAERIAGGALARGGLRVPFGRWITACGAPGGAPRSHDGPCWVRAVGRRSDTAPQARAWFTNPGWEKFPIPSGENFTAGEEGRTPLAPGLEGTSRLRHRPTLSTMVRVGCALSAVDPTLRPRPAPGSHIRAGKSFPSLRERISQQGRRDGPP